MNDQRDRSHPGRRDKDVTLAQVLTELQKIERKVEPLGTIAEDLATLKELAKAWNDAKVIGRAAATIGSGVKWLAGVAAAIVALWAVFKGSLIR